MTTGCADARQEPVNPREAKGHTDVGIIKSAMRHANSFFGRRSGAGPTCRSRGSATPKRLTPQNRVSRRLTADVAGLRAVIEKGRSAAKMAEEFGALVLIMCPS